jgi:hypothetical protein
VRTQYDGPWSSKYRRFAFAVRGNHQLSALCFSGTTRTNTGNIDIFDCLLLKLAHQKIKGLRL